MKYEQIYERHAEEYDALVNAEDVDGNLLPAIAALVRLPGASVLEVGSGTGRLTRLIATQAARIVGIERSPAMLQVARRHLKEFSASLWELHCADARSLPTASGWADLAIAGWVFGHFRSWMPDSWRADIGTALAEMRRALKPGGTLIVIETLGTGHERPTPPSPELQEYYRWLEDVQHMQPSFIRTDYEFPDVETAALTTGFFFGEAFADRVRCERWRHIPECTGLWSRRV